MVRMNVAAVTCDRRPNLHQQRREAASA